MTFNILGPVESIANFLGYSDATALLDDAQAIAKQHDEATYDHAVSDLATFLKKRVPSIPAATVDSISAILISLIAVGYDHSVHNVEVFVAGIIHAAPALGVKDAPLDDATKTALANCNSALDAWSIITQAVLKVEGVS